MTCLPGGGWSLEEVARSLQGGGARGVRPEDRCGETVEEAEEEELIRMVHERVEEGWPGKEEAAEKHHPPSAQDIREGTRGELDEDAGDGGGGDDQAQQFRRGSQVLGEAGEDRASGHLVPEAGEHPREYYDQEGADATGPPRP